MKQDWEAWTIKIFAVITAMPRWVGALLGAEGFALPAEWRPWWVVASALMSAGMAIVEGWAFAYVFSSWRNQKDKSGDRLLWFALFSALLFVGVLAPYIMASVRAATLSEILSNDWVLAAWAIAVGSSTISIVASVGYAQKRKAERPEAAPAPLPAKPEALTCHLCGATESKAGKPFTSQERLAAHLSAHARAAKNGKAA